MYCFRFLRLPLFHIIKSPSNITAAQPWYNVGMQRWQKYSQIQHRHNLVQRPTNNVGPKLNRHSLVCGLVDASTVFVSNVSPVAAQFQVCVGILDDVVLSPVAVAGHLSLVDWFVCC